MKPGPGHSGMDRFIFNHYARSALIPILTIELLLLVIYFGVNWYTSGQSTATLRSEVVAVMPHLTKVQADLIDADFKTIDRSCDYFAREHAALFADPASRPIQGEAPTFAIAPSGGFYQTNRKTETSLFYSQGKELTAEQRNKARFTAGLDPLYRHMVSDVPYIAASYFNSGDNMNRLFPFIPEVYNQYPPDLHMEDYNFYYLADAAHNPGKKPVWTGVYLDPAGQGWMLSCIAPVYVRQKLEGVVGLDVTVNNIVEKVLSQELPWGATAFLADQSGMILAMSPKAEKTLGLTELKEHVYSSAILKEQLKPEEFNLFKSKNPRIAATFKEIYASDDHVKLIAQPGAGDLFVVGNPIASTGWKLFILIEADSVLRSVNEVATLSSRIGLALVLTMLAFYAAFFGLLRRRAHGMARIIATPVAEISAAARELGQGSLKTSLPSSGITELDELSDTFTQMANELDARSRALVESEVRARVGEKESELAFARGMFESASGILHNVGNSITRLDSSLLDLAGIAKSTDQYPEVFERLAAGDEATLERFRSVLIDTTAPKIRDTLAEVKRIKEDIQQTIRHQQQSVRDSRAAMSPERLDLSALVRSAAEGASPVDGTIQVILSLPGRLDIIQHRNQLFNGIVNLIKNAVESCHERGSGKVEVELVETEGGARLTIRDDGAGVRTEDQGRLMSAGFTTKIDGNGFGMHSFAVFLSGNKGRLRLESPGPGRGATVTMEVGNA
ncbi:MAG: ATP-binding protein [Spirochaetota bacterium]